MELRQLEIFNAICKHKSFSDAATQLFLSQPTVSAHIKSLEDSLGLKLFIRKNQQHGNMTEAGEILHAYTEQIFSLMGEAHSALEGYKQGLSGSISLVTSHTICNWVLPDLLVTFKKAYPNIDIALHTDFSPQSIARVLQREVQFGIIRSPSPDFSNPNLISQCISVDESVVLMSPEHRLARREELSSHHLNNEPFIIYGKETNYWSQIHNIFSDLGVTPKTSMELNDMNAVKLMVQLGTGISILPEIAVNEELKKGTLVKMKVKDFPTIKRYSNLIYHKDLVPAGHPHNFIEFMSSRAFFNYNAE